MNPSTTHQEFIVISTSTTGAALLNAGIQALGSTSNSKTSGLCSAVASGASAITGFPEEAVSAVCSFSKESLGLLENAAEQGYDALTEALGDTGEWISDAADSVTRNAVSLYNDIASLAEGGVDAVGDAASAAADGVGSVANGLTSFGALALAAGGALLRVVG